VTDRSQCHALVDAATERFGIPWGLVNSAGATCVVSVLDVEPEAWRGAMAVNVDGTLHPSHAFATRLVAEEAPGPSSTSPPARAFAASPTASATPPASSPLPG